MALCRGASSSAAVSTSDAAEVDVEQERVVKAHFWFCYFALYFQIEFALSREVDYTARSRSEVDLDRATSRPQQHGR